MSRGVGAGGSNHGRPVPEFRYGDVNEVRSKRVIDSGPMVTGLPQ